MHRGTRTLALAAGLAAGLLGGCSSKEDDATRTAQEALGVKEGKVSKTTDKEVHNLTVIEKKETTVIDNTTNQVVSDKVEQHSTPVKITTERKEQTNVDVREGRTQTSKSSAAP